MGAQIFLIRHGETTWSLSGRHTGSTDLPLTETGEGRARLLREPLQGIGFARVFTSARQRARRTCELAGLAAGAQIDPDLHEWEYGDYEGRTTAEIQADRPGWNLFEDGCPDGESTGQISARADRVIARLRAWDGPTALFSHGHFLRTLAVRWIGLPVTEARHFDLGTASLSVLGFERGGRTIPVIAAWNTVPHASQPEQNDPAKH